MLHCFLKTSKLLDGDLLIKSYYSWISYAYSHIYQTLAMHVIIDYAKIHLPPTNLISTALQSTSIPYIYGTTIYKYTYTVYVLEFS